MYRGSPIASEQATESGGTLVLDDTFHANTVYENTAAIAKTAPTGPVLGTDSGRSLSRRLRIKSTTRRWTGGRNAFLEEAVRRRVPRVKGKIPNIMSYPAQAQYLGLYMTRRICLKRSSFAKHIPMC